MCLQLDAAMMHSLTSFFKVREHAGKASSDTRLDKALGLSAVLRAGAIPVRSTRGPASLLQLLACTRNSTDTCCSLLRRQAERS